jgi:hypothetical protein
LIRAWPCCPVARGHAAGELGEHLPEHALAAVAVDDALVVDEIGRSFRNRPLRHPGGDGLLFQISEEAVEGHAVVAGGAAWDWCRHWSGRRRHGLS